MISLAHCKTALNVLVSMQAQVNSSQDLVNQSSLRQG